LTNANLALIIADDLTGACDAAVHFAARGAATRVCLAPATSGAGVTALTTETRDAPEQAIVERIRSVAEAWSEPRPRIVFKKIDSILRGRPGLEIAVAMEAFDCEIAVVTPAFPAVGRIVRGGVLHVEGADARTSVAARLREDGFASPAIMPDDVATESDLRRLAADAFRVDKRILWAGSGGLASALASVLCGPIRPAIPPRAGRPMVFCIGSTCEATLVQQRRLAEARPSQRICRFEYGVATQQQVETQLAGTPPPALFCCGGDTASLVCAAIGARAIDLRGEVVTGVPWGTISGGIMDGVPIATKSGGFGGPDTLIQTADFFTCPNQ